MVKKVVMQLEKARVEVQADNEKGQVIFDNSVCVSVDELKEILSMYAYLNQQNTSNKQMIAKETSTNF